MLTNSQGRGSVGVGGTVTCEKRNGRKALMRLLMTDTCFGSWATHRTNPALPWVFSNCQGWVVSQPEFRFKPVVLLLRPGMTLETTLGPSINSVHSLIQKCFLLLNAWLFLPACEDPLGLSFCCWHPVSDCFFFKFESDGPVVCVLVSVNAYMGLFATKFSLKHHLGDEIVPPWDQASHACHNLCYCVHSNRPREAASAFSRISARELQPPARSCISYSLLSY